MEEELKMGNAEKCYGISYSSGFFFLISFCVVYEFNFFQKEYLNETLSVYNWPQIYHFQKKWKLRKLPIEVFLK